MKTYFFSILTLSISVAIHGAASSSEQPRQGRIYLVDNPEPNGIYFYQSQIIKRFLDDAGRPSNNYYLQGLHITGRTISEEGLANPRLQRGFPVPFDLDYRTADGSRTKEEHYVLPHSFCYRDLGDFSRFRDRHEYGNLIFDFHKEAHQAPFKRFPDVEKGSLYALCCGKKLPYGVPLPDDIRLYKETNYLDGPLLYSVADYFRCFPGLAYLFLKNQDPGSFDNFMKRFLLAATTFARMQGNKPVQRDFAEIEQEASARARDIKYPRPELPIGDIPAWPAQCMRSKKSMSFLECLTPNVPNFFPGRIICLDNHRVDLDEISQVKGEGNVFILSATDAITNRAVDINKHLAKQISLQRACVDWLYNHCYHIAACAAIAVFAGCIYKNHADWVAKRAKEIASITEQLAEQKKTYSLLRSIINSAQDKQRIAQLSADEMRQILTARLESKIHKKECARLANLMPEPWKLSDSLCAALKNKIDTIAGVGIGTYVADVCAKYFLGYRPYKVSCIITHDLFENGNYVYAFKNIPKYSQADREKILPYYDETTEQRFKQNQKKVAVVAAWAAAVYGLHKTLSK